MSLAAVFFAAVAWFSWNGALGLGAIGALLASTILWFAGRSRLSKDSRKTPDLVAKIVFTVVGCMALLRHPIEVADGEKLPLFQAISAYVSEVDPTTFILFAVIAMLVKFSGVIASAFSWHLLLRGQKVEQPFWQTTMTSFLIGRFIGTFLPSTIGLDGYTLYESGRYSNAWSRVVTAKGLEKFIGVTGLFLCMVLTMPFGYAVLVDVATSLGVPEKAPMLAGAILVVAGGISGGVILGLARPAILGWAVRVGANILAALPGLGGLANKIRSVFGEFEEAVTAYRGQGRLLSLALLGKFVTHFTTMAVYFFTALAIGVVGAKFWPIVFGSSIQILATLLSPTIAGEGAREAFQALLLQNQLGGVAQAVLSGALGFIAAEAATMWGGAFLLVRNPSWRPSFMKVDGQQVDYAWLDNDDAGFSAEALAEKRRQVREG